MTKRVRKSLLAAMTMLTLTFGANLMMTSANAAAAESDAKQAVLTVDKSMLNNLVDLKGKTVTVTLSTGQTLTGVVGDAKGGLVLLTKIAQREFYDALIAIDHISAIEARVR